MDFKQFREVFLLNYLIGKNLEMSDFGGRGLGFFEKCHSPPASPPKKPKNPKPPKNPNNKTKHMLIIKPLRETF